MSLTPGNDESGWYCPNCGNRALNIGDSLCYKCGANFATVVGAGGQRVGSSVTFSGEYLDEQIERQNLAVQRFLRALPGLVLLVAPFLILDYVISLPPVCNRCNGTGSVSQAWLNAHKIYRWTPGKCSVCGGSGHATADQQENGEKLALDEESKEYIQRQQIAMMNNNLISALSIITDTSKSDTCFIAGGQMAPDGSCHLGNN